ncbi:MAG: glycosyltransferase family 4 protein [Pyrobaculum sp.]
MRVCLVSTSMAPLPPWRFTGYGGAELIAYYALLEMAELEKVDLVAFATPQSSLPEGVRHLPVPPSYFDWRGERGLARRYRRELSLCDYVIDMSSTASVAEWEFLYRRPTVVVRNGYDLSRPLTGRYKLVVYTHAVRRYGEELGVRVDGVCRPTVRGEFYQVSREPGRYVLYLGRPHPSKGVDYVLKLAELNPSVRFVLAWRPTLPDHFHWHAEYSRVAKRLRNVSLLLLPGGERGEHVKRQLLSRAKLFVQPTVYLEAFGMAMAEALVSGTPVLTTTAGSGPELVDSSTGALAKNRLNLAEQAERWYEKLGEAVDVEELNSLFREALEKKWDREEVARISRERFRGMAECLLGLWR